MGTKFYKATRHISILLKLNNNVHGRNKKLPFVDIYNIFTFTIHIYHRAQYFTLEWKTSVVNRRLISATFPLS